MVSSNGTWLRLSKPREESRKVAMENKSVFNLGGKVVLTVENIVWFQVVYFILIN